MYINYNDVMLRTFSWMILVVDYGLQAMKCWLRCVGGLRQGKCLYVYALIRYDDFCVKFCDEMYVCMSV